MRMAAFLISGLAIVDEAGMRVLCTLAQYEALAKAGEESCHGYLRDQRNHADAAKNLAHGKYSGSRIPQHEQQDVTAKRADLFS